MVMMNNQLKSGDNIIIRAVYTKGAKPKFQADICSDTDYKRLLTGEKGYGTIRQPNFHKGLTFVAFSEVILPVSGKDGLTWRLFIDQDAGEVFAPLNTIITWMLPAVLFLGAKCFFEFIQGFAAEIRQ